MTAIKKSLKEFFSPKQIEPNSTELTTKFLHSLVAESPLEDYINLVKSNVQNDSGDFCLYHFKGGEPAYRCLDCQIDETCIQCIPCYQKANHEGHYTVMVLTGEGGCCDCGDEESWRKEGFCSEHNHSNKNGKKLEKKNFKNFKLSKTEMDKSKVLIDWLINFVTDAISGKQSVFILNSPLQLKFINDSDQKFSNFDQSLKIYDKNNKNDEIFENFENEKNGNFSKKSENNQNFEQFEQNNFFKTKNEQNFHQRFFNSERDFEGDCKNLKGVKKPKFSRQKTPNFIVYIHNTESIDWVKAKNILIDCIGLNVCTNSTLQMVDYCEFIAVFIGSLKECKDVAEKFEENKFPTTILKAPEEFYVITPEILEGILNWILIMCESFDEIKLEIKNCLTKQLTLNQKLQISPFTKMERKIFNNNQLLQSNLLHFEFLKNEKLLQNSESLDYFLKTNFSATKMNNIYLINYKGIRYFLKLKNDGKYKIYTAHPIIYKTLPYDVNDQKFTEHSKNVISTKSYRVDYWIKFAFRVALSNNVLMKFREIMFQMFVDYDFKIFWGTRYAKFYSDLVFKYNTSLDYTFSSLELGVQVLTNQKVSLELIKNHKLLENIIMAMVKCFEYNKFYQSIANPHFNNISLTMSRDIIFAMNEKVVSHVLKNKKLFILFVKMFQLYDNNQFIVRKIDEHVRYTDTKWTFIFTLEIQISKIMSSFLIFAESLFQKWVKRPEKAVLRFEILQDVIKQSIHLTKYSWQNFEGFKADTHQSSFHFPSNRFIAYLISLLFKAKNELEKNCVIAQSTLLTPTEAQNLFDKPAILLSVNAQIEAHIWILNGSSVVQQNYNYFKKCRTLMFDPDLLSLQIALCSMNAKTFFLNLFKKFQIHCWFSLDKNCICCSFTNCDDEKHIKVFERAMSLICRMYTARYHTGGLSRIERLKYYLIQQLIIKPMSHSKLRNFANKWNENKEEEFEQILEEIATVKCHSKGSPNFYYLKPEFYDFYDPFFFVKINKINMAKNNFKNEKQIPECFFNFKFPLIKPFENLKNILTDTLVWRFVCLSLNEFMANNEKFCHMFEICTKFIYISVLECKNNQINSQDKSKIYRRMLDHFSDSNEVPIQPSSLEKIFQKFKGNRSQYTPLRVESSPLFDSEDETNRKNSLSSLTENDILKKNLKPATCFSVVEILCRANNLMPSAMLKWILFNAAKLNRGVENVVLEYYQSIDCLDINKLIEEEATIKKRKILSDKCKELARKRITRSIEKFCVNNKITLTKNLPADKNTENGCIYCRSESVDDYKLIMCHAYKTGTLKSSIFKEKHRSAILEDFSLRSQIQRIYLMKNIFNCKHTIHSKCFMLLQNRNIEKKRINSCPACKTKINVTIPLIDITIEKPMKRYNIALLSRWMNTTLVTLSDNCSKLGNLEHSLSSQLRFLEMEILKIETNEIDIKDMLWLHDLKLSFGELAKNKNDCGGWLKIDNNWLEKVKSERPFFLQALIVKSLFDVRKKQLCHKFYNNEFNESHFCSWKYFTLAFGNRNKGDLEHLISIETVDLFVDCVMSLMPWSRIDLSQWKFFNGKTNIELSEMQQIETLLAPEMKCEENIHCALILLWAIKNVQILVHISFVRIGLIAVSSMQNSYKKIDDSKKFKISQKMLDLLLKTIKISPEKISPLFNIEEIEEMQMDFLRKTSLLLYLCGIIENYDIKWSCAEFIENLGLPSLEQLCNNSFILDLYDKYLDKMRPMLAVNGLVIFKRILPKLIDLPEKYEELFQLSRSSLCKRSGLPLNDPALCLLCGEIFSSNNYCCSKKCNSSKFNTHSKWCGFNKNDSNEGVYLVLPSNVVLLESGFVKAHFPSPYLDSFGETDEGLHQGRPLTLSPERYSRLSRIVLCGEISVMVMRYVDIQNNRV